MMRWRCLHGGVAVVVDDDENGVEELLEAMWDSGERVEHGASRARSR
mgnify:CR=1 FL=1